MAATSKTRKRPFRNSITQKRLKECLRYDQSTGNFIWISNNKTAGHTTPKGYVTIRIDGVSYLAHRLAFLYVTSKWPSKLVDHKNSKSNAWHNLREASNAENIRHAKRRANNITGYKGVSFIKKTKKFYASIMVDYKSISLGCYDTAKEAYAAYCKAAEKFHGEFARLE